MLLWDVMGTFSHFECISFMTLAVLFACKDPFRFDIRSILVNAFSQGSFRWRYCKRHLAMAPGPQRSRWFVATLEMYTKHSTALFSGYKLYIEPPPDCDEMSNHNPPHQSQKIVQRP